MKKISLADIPESIKVKVIPTEILQDWYDNKIKEIKHRQKKFYEAETRYRLENNQTKNNKKFIEEENPSPDEAYKNFKFELHVAHEIGKVLKKRRSNTFFLQNNLVPIISVMFSAAILIIILLSK